MTITVPAAALTAALKKCETCISPRSTLPILGSVLLTAEGETLTLMSSSLDAWAVSEIPATVKKAGSVCLDHRTLTRIAACGGDITISIDGKLRATITTGSSKFAIGGLAAGEFPDPPAVAGKGIPIPAEDWISAASRTSPAEHWDETRYTLCGTLLTSPEGTLSFVATNGSCLVLQRTDHAWETSDAIIPTATMRAITSICPDDGEITLTVTSSHIYARAGGDIVVSKLIEGNYPNYRQVIPDYKPKEGTRITISSSSLTTALKTLGTVIDAASTNRAIRIATARDSVHASFPGSEKFASTDIAAKCTGPEAIVGLNPVLLGSLIRPVPGDLEITLMDEVSPIRITQGQTTIILMPMRILT